MRAIATVEQALATFGPPVYVRHAIVHNAHVVDDLERRGALLETDDDPSPVGQGDVDPVLRQDLGVEAAFER